MVKPIERVLRSGLFGPWDRPIPIETPPAVNPARSKVWGVDSFHFFPNFMLLVWAPNWYLTYHYWPTSYNTHVFEGTLYFVPPKTASERLAQELAAVTFKEYALQDGNTLEATQTMLESRAVTEFPLNDQEILLRHLHTTAGRYVSEYQRARRRCGGTVVGCVVTEGTTMPAFPAAFADLEPFADWALETERERYAKRLSSSMDALQAFYDAVFPRLEADDGLPGRLRAPGPPRRRDAGCCGCATRSSTRHSRSRCGGSHASPTAAPRASTSSSSPRSERSRSSTTEGGT